jgi:hypothetical protein
MPIDPPTPSSPSYFRIALFTFFALIAFLFVTIFLPVFVFLLCFERSFFWPYIRWLCIKSDFFHQVAIYGISMMAISCLIVFIQRRSKKTTQPGDTNTEEVKENNLIPVNPPETPTITSMTIGRTWLNFIYGLLSGGGVSVGFYYIWRYISVKFMPVARVNAS